MKLRMKNLLPSWQVFKEISSIGLAPFVMQFASTVVAILLNNGLKTYGGDIAIGAMTVINSVMLFFFMPVMGITQGAQPILGFNYGAKRYERVRATLKLEMIIATAICVFAFLCTQFLTVPLIKAFNSEAALIEAASYGMRLMLMMTLNHWFSNGSRTIFSGNGQSKKGNRVRLVAPSDSSDSTAPDYAAPLSFDGRLDGKPNCGLNFMLHHGNRFVSGTQTS